MKAFSLWQPWASAVALGLKRIETRHWSTAYRGPLVIHAAKRWTYEEIAFWDSVYEDDAGRLIPEGYRPPLGAIVAVCRLVDIRPSEELAGRISELEYSWGNYGPRRFGWLLEDVKPLAAAIPFKGAQGLFDIPESVVFGGPIPEEFRPLPPRPPARKPPRPQGELFQ
jgi:activating signal cointegrator 1